MAAKKKQTKKREVVIPEIAEKGEVNLGGRPPFYKTPEELSAKVDEYFEKGIRTVKRKAIFKGLVYEYEIKKATITGLVLYLGYSDRASFYDLEKIPKFTNIIKRARTLIEREYEEQLDLNSAGSIFALKNFGWTDRQEIDIEVEDKSSDETTKSSYMLFLMQQNKEKARTISADDQQA